MIFKLVPFIKDIILIVVALTTIFVAIYGLNKWKVEHKGKAYFDAAMELLAAIYSVRNNFEIVRSGWLDVSEFPEGYSSKHPSELSDEDKANATWYVYKNRLGPLTLAMNELDIALVEGEVIWGSEVKEQGRKVNGSYNRLVRSIKNLVGDEYQGMTDPGDEIVKRYRKDVASSRESEDDLSKQINVSVEYFEKLLSPYVRAKSN